MRSWCSCLLDDDVACGRPSSISPSPQRPSALKRKWCSPDLEDLKPEGPRSTGRSSKKLGQQWCTLTIDEDDEVLPEPRHDWRQLNVQDDVPQHGWRRPSVEDHPEPEALPARRKEVSLSASTLAFLSNNPKKKTLNSYDKNGMDPVRIRCVLQGCKCQGPCVRRFTFEEIYDLCCLYHSMLESDRQFMLHTMYTNEAASQVQGPTGHGPKSRQQWYILGRRVCVYGFVVLLGISENNYTRTSDLPLIVGVLWTIVVPSTRGTLHN